MWHHRVKNHDRDAGCVFSMMYELNCIFLINMPLKLPRRFSGDRYMPRYEGWNFNSGHYLFTTDTK